MTSARSILLHRYAATLCQRRSKSISYLMEPYTIHSLVGSRAFAAHICNRKESVRDVLGNQAVWWEVVKVLGKTGLKWDLNRPIFTDRAIPLCMVLRAFSPGALRTPPVRGSRIRHAETQALRPSRGGRPHGRARL